jgi:hypothetical protein
VIVVATVTSMELLYHMLRATLFAMTAQQSPLSRLLAFSAVGETLGEDCKVVMAAERGEMELLENRLVVSVCRGIGFADV